MASARFQLGSCSTVDGSYTWGSVDSPIDVLPLYYVQVRLESTAGVSFMDVTIPSADEVTTIPTVTKNTSTGTATFRMPALAATVLVQVQINGGRDGNGQRNAEYTKRLAAHVLTTNGGRLLAIGETNEYSRVFGYIKKINDAIKYVPGELPAGTQYQHLEHNGTTWVAVDDITLPSGPSRFFSSSNGDLTIEAGGASKSVKISNSDGTALVECVENKLALSTSGGAVGFYGTTPTGKFTINWSSADPQSQKDLFTALVAIGLIDGVEIPE